MKIGNTTIDPDWTEGSLVSNPPMWYKRCRSRIKCGLSIIYIIKKGDIYNILIKGFPLDEYNSMFGVGNMREFNSLQAAKDQVDYFLSKLNSLKVFL